MKKMQGKLRSILKLLRIELPLFGVLRSIVSIFTLTQLTSDSLFRARSSAIALAHTIRATISVAYCVQSAEVLRRNGYGLHCSYASSNKNQIMCLHNCCKPMLNAKGNSYFFGKSSTTKHY